ncbi:MAG: hypothetical protein ACI8PT_000084 [Gammaproteobacteria bacterium]|jgi:uncharacterized protein (DUF924 family)
MTTESINDIVQFWLHDSEQDPVQADARRRWWYFGDRSVDEAIDAQFGYMVRRAIDGEFGIWGMSSMGSLGLVLLLDQFTRNLYRHTPRAYAGDARAFLVVSEAVAAGLDTALHPVSRIWLYHPFHHCEDLYEQDRALGFLQSMEREADSAWQPYIARSVQGWTRHRNIVARFGRFPHRNEVLGRESSAEEVAFLAQNSNAFGQGAR